jgi:predicted acyl esterase
VLSDVDSSGASNQVTAGFLLASQRAVDARRSTYGPGGVMIRPFHPFTRDSQEAVTPNDPELYRIEIYPTSNLFKKGDSIRLTIGTANTPSTSTPVPDLANELGGEIRVLHGGKYASHVLLPIAG